MSIVKSHPCFLTPSKLNPDYPLFVFLPGMDGTGQLLRAQTTGLEAAFDVRCLAIPADDLTSWDELSSQVVALIEAEIEKQPKRSVYLCGESFGGCLALKIALRSPQLFDRLILINPASSFNQRPCLSLGIPVIRLLPEFIYKTSAVGFVAFLSALERVAPPDRRALLDAMHSVPPATVLWRLSLLKDFHVDESKLHSLTQPVLLIAGANDRLLPSVAEAKRLVQCLPNAKMMVLPHSGHACLLEQDINLAKIMQAHNFLEQRDKTHVAVTSAINEPVGSVA